MHSDTIQNIHKLFICLDRMLWPTQKFIILFNVYLDGSRVGWNRSKKFSLWFTITIVIVFEHELILKCDIAN